MTIINNRSPVDDAAHPSSEAIEDTIECDHCLRKWPRESAVPGKQDGRDVLRCGSCGAYDLARMKGET